MRRWPFGLVAAVYVIFLAPAVAQGWLPLATNTSFAFSPPALAESYQQQGGNTDITSFYRDEPEVCYNQIQVTFWSHEASPSTGWTAVVAGTEADGTDQTSSYSPVVAGTAYNVLAANSSSFGWQQVTVGGASTWAVPAGTASAPGSIVSDWITMPYVPRTTGGVRPLTLARVHHNGLTNGTDTRISGLAVTRWAWANGNIFYRHWDGASLAGDSVGTLSSVPATSYYLNSGSVVWVSFQYRGNCRVRSWSAIGDSITSGDGGPFYGFDTWGTRAIWSVSRPSNPMSFFNGGMSGQTSATYFSNFTTSVIGNGNFPTDMIFAGFTPNDGTPTDAAADTRMALVGVETALGRRYGAQRLWLWTGICSTPPYTGAAEAARLYNNGLINAYPGTSGVFQFDADVCDGGNPEQFKPGYGPVGVVHPTLLGFTAMAADMANVIGGTFAPEFTHVPFIRTDNPQQSNLLSLIPAQIPANPIATSDVIQWLRDSVAIVGATSQNYRLTSSDVGHAITVHEVTTIQGTVFDYTTAATSTIVSNPISTPDDISGYTFNGATGQAAATTDPLGNASAASTFTELAGTSTHIGSVTLSVTSGKTYDIVVYAENLGRQYIQLIGATTGFGGNCYANYDLNGGSVTAVGSAVVGQGMNPAPVSSIISATATGWWELHLRCTATSTTAGSALTLTAITASNSARGQSFAGTAGVDYGIWGVQSYQTN